MKTIEIHFDHEEHFENFLMWNEEAKDVLRLRSHEKAHFDKAEELGYSPTYGFKRTKRHTQFFKETYFIFLDRDCSPNHFKEIALAPKNPGEKDKIYASKPFLFLYSIYYILFGVKK
tara:strand:+ start:471 stop:821 length:351 start_codon:yes stop_codon:yes gene_type:complete